MAEFMLADTFMPSLSKLTPKEQARGVKFLIKLQKNPRDPGIKQERVTKALSDDVWSGRITQELRAILYKSGSTLALLYAGHHDSAYDWARRRTIGRHSITGALQIVESVETIEKKIVATTTPGAKPLLKKHDDAYLLSLGVPESWLPTLRKVTNEDQVLTVCEKLPEDVAERLLDLAEGKFVTPPAPVAATKPASDSPDTHRRFFVVDNEADLHAVLSAPMEKWVAFLHPSQKKVVEGKPKGPVKVTGSAGTGKTVVAMHRARHLARQGEQVLLTSYVGTLCLNIERSLKLFCSEEELGRIKVSTVHKQALDLVRQVDPRIRPASEADTNKLLDRAIRRYGAGFEEAFVKAEWEHVIQIQGIGTWASYRKAKRTGRGKPLSVRDRKSLWQVFEDVYLGLKSKKLIDWPSLSRRAFELLEEGKVESPYTAVVVDEVQDLKPAELRFLAVLCKSKPQNLMLTGDAGQRIYPGGFSLKALGIEVVGRSHVLRINYRTTEQIRRAADQVLSDSVDDLDGGKSSRKGTKSLLSGPAPILKGFKGRKKETTYVVDQVRHWIAEGLKPKAIGVFARSNSGIKPIKAGLEAAGITCHLLSDQTGRAEPGVQLGTMHRVKGLEFKAVMAVDCSSKVLPSQYALSGLDDPKDIEDARERERRLLYVVMTRARDELHVTWVGEPSPFLNHVQAK
jgi:hypothetical protein